MICTCFRVPAVTVKIQNGLTFRSLPRLSWKLAAKQQTAASIYVFVFYTRRLELHKNTIKFWPTRGRSHEQHLTVSNRPSPASIAAFWLTWAYILPTATLIVDQTLSLNSRRSSQKSDSVLAAPDHYRKNVWRTVVQLLVWLLPQHIKNIYRYYCYYKIRWTRKNWTANHSMCQHLLCSNLRKRSRQ